MKSVPIAVVERAPQPEKKEPTQAEIDRAIELQKRFRGLDRCKAWGGAKGPIPAMRPKSAGGGKVIWPASKGTYRRAVHGEIGSLAKLPTGRE